MRPVDLQRDFRIQKLVERSSVVTPGHSARRPLPMWVRTVRRPVVRAVTSMGPALLPQGGHIVFISAHSDDPDALVVLEYLAQRSPRPLPWLAPEKPNIRLIDEDLRARIRVRRLTDPAGIWAFLTSKLVFHTYGVYGLSRARARQVIVNVWHGDGPKRMRPDPIATTYMVTGVQEFGRRRMEILGLPFERLFTTGRPRVDDMHRGLSQPEQMQAQRRLGLDDRPIVWWLPTWRERDGSPDVLKADMSTYFDAEAFAALSNKYQFVVKPHANSPTQEWPSPWIVVEPKTLEQSHVRWYRLLGCAAAILTDYSSVWSDFLHTKIPVAFVTPDPDTYANERGFYMTNWRDALPGPLLHGRGDVTDFLTGLDSLPDVRHRTEVAGALGAANTPGATARLLVALAERGVSWW